MHPFLEKMTIFVALCIFIYFVFRIMPDLSVFKERGFQVNDSLRQEGLTTQNTSPNDNKTVAEGAKAYGVLLKITAEGLSNMLLVDKYRADYESIILNTDDVIDRLMLLNVLTIDKKDPYPALEKLVMLNQSKVALDRVLHFVDTK
jgi:hypothetical protein